MRFRTSDRNDNATLPNEPNQPFLFIEPIAIMSFWSMPVLQCFSNLMKVYSIDLVLLLLLIWFSMLHMKWSWHRQENVSNVCVSVCVCVTSLYMTANKHCQCYHKQSFVAYSFIDSFCKLFRNLFCDLFFFWFFFWFFSRRRNEKQKNSVNWCITKETRKEKAKCDSVSPENLKEAYSQMLHLQNLVDEH